MVTNRNKELKARQVKTFPTRRTFLSFSMCVFFSPLSSTQASPFHADAAGACGRYEFLCSATRNVEEALWIGQRYLSEVAEASRSVACFLDDVDTIFPEYDWKSTTVCREFSRWLKKRINLDFLEGNTTRVDGWHMAYSEAAFCSTLAKMHLEKSRNVN